jgi:hypothetical protein
VDLAVKGPPFHGVAHVHLSVISFSIAFGDESSAPSPIGEWHVFENSFLDRRASETEVARVHQLHLAAGQIIRPGAPEQPAGAADDTPWLVRADELTLAAMSAIPASELVLGTLAPGAALPSGTAAGPGQTMLPAQLKVTALPVSPGALSGGRTVALGLRPMGVKSLASPLVVTIVRENADGKVANLDNLQKWTLEEDRSAMPAAVWDITPLNTTGVPDAKTVDGCIVGIRRLRPPTGGPRGQSIGGVTADALGADPLDDLALGAEQRTPQAAPRMAWDAIPQVEGDATLRESIKNALVRAGFAEAAHFETQAGIARPLDAVPLAGAMA